MRVDFASKGEKRALGLVCPSHLLVEIREEVGSCSDLVACEVADQQVFTLSDGHEDVGPITRLGDFFETQQLANGSSWTGKHIIWTDMHRSDRVLVPGVSCSRSQHGRIIST